ncbi:hypothetical protein BASA50_006960 [Batrachochytrium salamandrivorans]|uniref:CDP-diacylglycerol--inositol 3-phosphatidyltransferase n=1 Tax=Batrachochytrium salamandrivorans TaxID=1357716 RepID=A0ABQ8F8J5_9FUNG|nr:hypothetical protein BASA60_011229 [Batrachochytrium salamandrivorans]KAH6562194.1 hypothetical protein BASA62_009335 [Batrachochytrium salamandrivorans]KAH6594054.1 hypothetical protein BASA50_006960 [Batrachochytrium salamandrivorans]KAH6602929.1 hypothetical protein BASA61_000606 [Batrachochytrium salamandrivorans]KAH9256536.1 hypothetical protein BASA81_005451 [Batrachochytrium salamandrivorans]
MSTTTTLPISENVFLFVPNLIGYGRISLAILSFYYMAYHPWLSMALYALSCLLDAVDGYAARLCNQSSKFGAVLDMVTDRSTTTALIVYLATQYPLYAFPLQMLTALDLSSHYMQMYASLIYGHASHKTVSASAPWMLRMYYTSKPVLFGVCLGNEMFFIGLYLRSWSIQALFLGGSLGAWVWMIITACFWVSVPVMVFKQAVNIIQLVGACSILAESDINDRRAVRGDRDTRHSD